MASEWDERDPVRARDYIHVTVGRPTRFAHNRYLGDKRTQVVYDLNVADTDPQVAAAIDELLASEQFATFGPDTMAEASNRGYRPHRSIRRAQPSATGQA